MSWRPTAEPQDTPVPEPVEPDVEAILIQRTQAEWLAAFDGIEIPLEPVLDFTEMLEHPQVRARGLIRPARDGGVPDLLSPFPFPPAEGEAPELGRDTRRILLDAGYSEGELTGWDEKGLIKLA